jgi:hypothetical protein
MNGSRFSLRSKTVAKLCLPALVLGTLLFHPVFTGATPTKASDGKNTADDRRISGQIECIMPDGRLAPVLNGRMPNPETPALLMAENTISCDLQEGDTVFIIPVPKTDLLDRFTFVNQNAAACGEFNIAISDSRLSPNSRNWIQVDGIVPFSHKRLFNLSLLGTGAKYVRLSFHVEKASRITRIGFHSANTERSRIAAEPPPPAAGPADN